MSLALKPGVSVTKLQPQALLILLVADGVWREFGIPQCVMTSGDDGSHMEGSLHYQGLAVDLRLNGIAETTQMQILTMMKGRLGEQYDVIREVKGGVPHLHCEHQVKTQDLGVRA